MSTTSEVTPRVSLIRRLSDFVREVDEAIHYDPVAALEQRVRRLEQHVANQPTDHRDERLGGENG